ncbi:hypothetical protein ACFVIY_30930 [Streptomyces sp. NPDC127166]|uniref:hypothetical protein n=1 Tax=Streptomyces sp. NPDC127166 TaxID=3345380 RepID=UPI00363905BF
MRTDRRAAILEGAARVTARRGVRGPRAEEPAAAAGVSTAPVSCHFKDRAGVLRHTLEFTGGRTERCTAAAEGATEPSDPRQGLERSLPLEFQDTPEVRENSTAWGEPRTGAIFEPDLRAGLSQASLTWSMTSPHRRPGCVPTCPPRRSRRPPNG